jgi:Cu(I)/Ag(I) efflux system protein CusF
MNHRATSTPALAIILAATLFSTWPALAAEHDMGDMNMSNMDMSHAQQATEAVGVVEAVNSAKGIVTISHEPIKSLNWPAMTMEFVLKDKKAIAKLSKGKKIQFTFVEKHGDYVITSVK